MVDARIGPGLKSMSKCKKRKEELDQNGTTKFGQSSSNVQNIRNNERFRKICKKDMSKGNMLTKKAKLCDENSAPTSPSSNSDIDRMSDDAIELDLDTYDSISMKSQSRRNKWKSQNPEKNLKINRSSTVIDANYWTCVKTCCGIIYESKDCRAVLVDFDKYMVNSCPKHEKKNIAKLDAREAMTSVIKSLPPKKQHLHRQTIIELSSSTEKNVQTAPIDYSIANCLNDKNSSPIQFYSQIDEIRGTNGEVIQQKNDTRATSNRVYKKSITRVLPKKITNDLSVIKNLVKLCTDKRLIDTTLLNPHESQFSPHNENKNITNTVNSESIITKYSDNSSDSGYEPESLMKTSNLTEICH